MTLASAGHQAVPGRFSVGRAAIAAILGLVGLLAPAPSAGMPTADRSPVGTALAGIYRQWRDSVVQIVSYRFQPTSSRPGDDLDGMSRIEPQRCTLWSSGLVVDGAGRVITCAEAAQPGDSLELRLADGRRIGARFLAQDVGLGLSLIQANEGAGLVPPPPPADLVGAAGDWVFIVGFPANAREPDLRLGTLAGPTSDPTGRYLSLSLHDCHGSCGAVVVDAYGRLRGLVVDVRTDRDTDRVGGRDPRLLDPLECEWVRALNGSLLEPIAAALEASSRAPAGFLGVRAQADSTEASAQRPGSNRLWNRPLQVAWVLPGSPAEAAGIRPGDQILSIDDRAVGQVSEIADLIASSLPGTVVRVRLLRDGIPLELAPRLVDRSALEWQERERQLNLVRQRRVRASIQQLERRLKVLEQEHARLQ